MTKKHLLIAGHGYSDPGAHGNGENERDFIRREVIKRVAKYINATKGHKAEMYNLDWNMFADTAAGQRQNKAYGMYKYNTNSFASMTEFHLDAASSSATGGHVIITDRFNADAIDRRLGDAIKKYVGLRGGKAISKRNDLLQVNVAADRNINYRLVELGFITNKKDMDNIKKNIEAYCKALAEAITGSTSTQKAPAPVKKTTTPKKKTTVKKDTKPKTTKALKWQTNKHGTQWAKTSGVWVNGNQPVIKRKGSPMRSAPSSGAMKPGQRLDYREIARSDGHIWLLDKKSDQWVPVKTWNSRTGAVGHDFGKWL